MESEKRDVLKRVKRCEKILYIILFVGFLNTVLRPNAESEITLFRILLPLGVLMVVIISRKEFLKFVLVSSIFVIVSLMQQYFYTYKNILRGYSNNNYYFYSYVFFYLCIIYVLFLVKVIKKLNKDNFETSFYKFLFSSYIIFIIYGYIELITGFHFSTVCDRGIAIQGFFWTENEFSNCIAAFFPFLLILGFRKNKLFNFILILLSIFIVYINDSKIALIGMVVQTIISIFFWFENIKEKRYRYVMKRIFILIGAISIAVIVSVNPKIKFSNTTENINELIIEPITRILKLEPYGDMYGSINNRTDMVIYGAKEYLDFNLLGIGPGNSILFLENSGKIGSAKSLHNFILQVLLETGPIAIVIYIAIIMKIYGWIKLQDRKSYLDKVSIIFFVSFPIFSLSSSAGFFSLYYIFAIIAFLIFRDNKNLIIKKQSM